MSQLDQSGRKEVLRFFMYMAVWSGVVCIWSWWQEKTDIIPGFALGAAGSICYVVHLYRQLTTTIERTDANIEASMASMRSGWFIRLMVVCVLLIISLKLEDISFLAVLFGLFSFQISLFGYAAVVSVHRVFYQNDFGR